MNLPQTALLAILLMSGQALVADPGERLSREELLARRAASQAEIAKYQAEEPEVSSKHPSQKSILDRSVILTSGSHWTFVPKGAVINLPERYAQQVGGERKGTYIPFADFAQRNRGWLSTLEIELEQARGNKVIEKNRLEVIKKSGRVAVATMQNGPVSVRQEAFGEQK